VVVDCVVTVLLTEFVAVEFALGAEELALEYEVADEEDSGPKVVEIAALMTPG